MSAVQTEHHHVYNHSRASSAGKRTSLLLNERLLPRDESNPMLEDSMEDLVKLPISEELISSRLKAKGKSSKSRAPESFFPSASPRRPSLPDQAESLGYATPGSVAYSPGLTRTSSISSQSSIPRPVHSRRGSSADLRSSASRREASGSENEVSYYPNDQDAEILSSPALKGSKIPRFGNSSNSNSSYTLNSLVSTSPVSPPLDQHFTTSAMQPPPVPLDRSGSRQTPEDLSFPSTEAPTTPRRSEEKRQPLSSTQANAKRRLSRDLDSLASTPSSIKRSPSKSTQFPPTRKASLSRSTPASTTRSASTSPSTPRSERARAVTGNLTSRKRPGIVKALPTTPLNKPRPRSVSTSLLSDFEPSPKAPWEKNASPLLYKSERDETGDVSMGEEGLPLSQSRTWDDVIIPTVAKQIHQKMMLQDSNPDELIEEWTRDGMPARSVTMPSLLSSKSLNLQSEAVSTTRDPIPLPQQASSAGPSEPTHIQPEEIEMQEAQAKRVPQPVQTHLEAWQHPALASPTIAKETLRQRKTGEQTVRPSTDKVQKKEGIDGHKGGCRCVIS